MPHFLDRAPRILSIKYARHISHCMRGVLAIAGVAFALSSSAAQAQEISSSRAYVVHNDRGGLLTSRIAEIRALQETGQQIKISGRVCQSTCTMFLGLEQTCISPETVFGFHGPSSYGRRLSRPVFEQASQIIASHYPAPLKRWYMDEARHSIWRMHRITGKQMLSWGISRSC